MTKTIIDLIVLHGFAILSSYVFQKKDTILFLRILIFEIMNVVAITLSLITICIFDTSLFIVFSLLSLFWKGIGFSIL